MDVAGAAKSRLFHPHEAAARKRWALQLVGHLEGATRMLGYGLFHGGSMVRDLDLVAVPWSSKALKPDEFVLELAGVFNFQMGNRGDTVGGHKWYALWDRNHPDHQIDLKVILPVPQPGPDDKDNDH